MAHASARLRAVGDGDRAARRRTDAPRRRRDAVRHARLDHLRPARRRLRAPVRGAPRARRSRVGGAPRRSRPPALGGLRPDPQPPRLAAAGVRGPVRDADGDHGPRVLLAADPARLPALAQRLRLDLRRRSRGRARLRRNRPSRRRRRGAAVLLHVRRRARLPRPDSSRQGDGPGRSRSLAPPGGRWSCAVRCRTSATSPRRSSRMSTAATCATSDRWGRRSAPRFWATPRCLLHPIAFAEPFGLAVVESMLCGTPVVAYPRGSMPELVEDGVTGVLVDTRRLGRRRDRTRAALRSRRLPPDRRTALLGRPHGRRLPLRLRERAG